MENLAVHMRITGTQVTNEDVDTRRSAIADLSNTWTSSRSVDQSLATATDIALALNGDAPPEALGTEVQVYVQKYASAFLYGESPFEVGIVAGMAFAEIAKAKPRPTVEWTTPEILSAAVWSALSYQEPMAEAKREALRSEVLKAAERYVAAAAEASRARSSVADFKELSITLASAGGAGGDDSTAALPTASSNFEKATSATITALRRNAALDREELDFLWWAQLGRSRLLDRRLASLAEPVRLVTAGVEGADHLRRLPCEVHRDVVLRTLDKDPELDLRKLLAAMGADRVTVGGRYVGGWATKWPIVFPLLNAVATGRADGPGHAIKRRAATWGARALLEAAMIRYLENGAAKL